MLGQAAPLVRAAGYANNGSTNWFLVVGVLVVLVIIAIVIMSRRR